MLNICIWMNIPSHYQSAFFDALTDCGDVDLKVVYLNGTSDARAAEGWSDRHDLRPFERNAEGLDLVEHIDALLPDWADRVHLICGYFASGLIDHFCRNGTAWCHWSEKPGIRLAELLGFRTPLYRLLNPLMLRLKRSEGRRIRNHALGAFSQGFLARKAFRRMGIPDAMTADLFYVPAPLAPRPPSVQVRRFAAGRRVFVAVGALCRRKGIDVLIRAFARMDNDRWCLVLCGLDRSGGRYRALVSRLGLEDRVCFLGAYPSERIAEVYAAADVFVLASRFDGWGAVLNEAASLGLPLIGTDLCGGSWHLIAHELNGFRVLAGSVPSLARAMQAYADEPARIRRHGDASRSLFFAEFTPARNARRLTEALATWRAR